MKANTLTIIFFLAFAFGCIIGVAKAQTINTVPQGNCIVVYCHPQTGVCSYRCFN